MKIQFASVYVDDQEKALKFYTQTLGFIKMADIPIGEYRWLTVVSPEAPEGPELVLEPGINPAVVTFKQALLDQGVPFTAFPVTDIQAEYERLVKLGVRFISPPTDMGPITGAIIDDTCGNLIQIVEAKPIYSNE